MTGGGVNALDEFGSSAILLTSPREGDDVWRISDVLMGLLIFRVGRHVLSIRSARKGSSPNAGDDYRARPHPPLESDERPELKHA